MCHCTFNYKQAMSILTRKLPSYLFRPLSYVFFHSSLTS